MTNAVEIPGINFDDVLYPRGNGKASDLLVANEADVLNIERTGGMVEIRIPITGDLFSVFVDMRMTSGDSIIGFDNYLEKDAYANEMCGAYIYPFA